MIFTVSKRFLVISCKVLNLRSFLSRITKFLLKNQVIFINLLISLFALYFLFCFFFQKNAEYKVVYFK